MTGSFSIRRAAAGDAAGIARVHVETWRSAYAGILPDRVMTAMSIEEKTTAWRRLVQGQSQTDAVLVAELDDRSIGGFASCGPAGAEVVDHDGEIHTLYVLPDWQEQGLGRALLHGCFGALANSGFDSAFVWVLADNPARFFYEAMGGVRIGERNEQLWGTVLRETSYGWHNLSALIEAGPAAHRPSRI